MPSFGNIDAGAVALVAFVLAVAALMIVVAQQGKPWHQQGHHFSMTFNAKNLSGAEISVTFHARRFLGSWHVQNLGWFRSEDDAIAAIKNQADSLNLEEVPHG